MYTFNLDIKKKECLHSATLLINNTTKWQGGIFDLRHQVIIWKHDDGLQTYLGLNKLVHRNIPITSFMDEIKLSGKSYTAQKNDLKE